LRDQEVLRLVDEWVEDPSPARAVLQRVYNDAHFAHVWGYFSYRLSRLRFMQFVDQVFALMLERNGAAATGEHHAFSVLWRAALRFIQPNGESKTWIEGKLHTALSRSLSFCNDIYYYWAGLRAHLVSLADREVIRGAIVERAREIFTPADPMALVRVLSNEKSYSIRHFIF